MAYKGSEKRKYIRLNSCFPIEFSLVSFSGKYLSKKYQGFTCDISKGGMCIKIKNLDAKDADVLVKGKARLDINASIFYPFFQKPIHATGRLAWMDKTAED